MKKKKVLVILKSIFIVLLLYKLVSADVRFIKHILFNPDVPKEPTSFDILILTMCFISTTIIVILSVMYIKKIITSYGKDKKKCN